MCTPLCTKPHEIKSRLRDCKYLYTGRSRGPGTNLRPQKDPLRGHCCRWCLRGAAGAWWMAVIVAIVARIAVTIRTRRVPASRASITRLVLASAFPLAPSAKSPGPFPQCRSRV